MTTDSPAAILYDSDGYELAVKPNIAIPANTRGILEAGTDGTNARFISVNSSGQQVVVGAGIAGTPSGGIITIQGDPSGTPVPISGSITTSNASIGITGAAVPASATQIAGSDGTNLQTLRVFDVDSGGGTQYVVGVNLRLSSSGGSVELGTASNPIRIDPTGTTIQPISGTVTANAGTGTFTVGGTITSDQGSPASLANAWSTKITDGTNGPVTVKPASTAPLATDPALVVAISPNTAISSHSDGYATTASPSYTNNTFNPLSLTTAGALRVDGSAVTQPVSGTVAATQSGTWTVQPGNTANTTPWLTTINQGGNSATVTASNALKVDGSAVTQPVSGTVTANAGTGNFTVVQATASNLNATVVGTGTDNTTNSTAKLPVLGALANTAAPTWTNGNMVPLSVDTSGALRIGGSITASNASIGSNGSAIPTSSTQIGGSDGTNLQALRVFDADSGAGTQYVLGVNLRLSSSGGSVELGTATNPIRIDPTGTTTQPVSGTVTANIGTTGGLALDTSVNGILLSQGSTTSGEKGPLVQGAVTTAAPTYTTAQTSPLSLTTAGSLRVDGSGSTQPVSGTVAATQSGTWTVQPGNTANTTPWLATINQGGNSATVTASNALKIDGSAVTQPVSGTVTANAGTGNFTVVGTATDNTTNSTAKLPVMAALANTSAPTWTNGNMVPLSVDTAGNLRTNASNPSVSTTGTSPPASATYIGGSVTTAAPTYTTGQMDPLSLTTSGALRIDGSGTTQPVSGTVAATQSGTWTVQPGNTANTTPWLATINQGGNSATVSAGGALKVDGSAVTQPVSGTVTANIGSTGGLALDATLTGGTQTTRITDGTNTATVKAASTAAIATDKALVVAISPNNPITTAPQVDSAPATQNITAQDTGSTSTGVANGGFFITGSPTAGSTALFTVSTIEAIKVQVTGTWTGTLTLESSIDSGTTWYSSGIHQNGTSYTTNNFTANFIGGLNASAATNFRVRATASWTGTATVKIIETVNANSIYIVNPLKLADATTQSIQNTIKAASTAAIATDTALVVAISPNNTVSVLGTGTDNTTNSTAKLPVLAALVNTSAPTWSNGNMAPLSVDTSGNLRITGSISATNPSVSTTGTSPPASATYIGGSVTTSSPSYTNGQMNALSLTTSGALRIDGSAVTQPVSGTGTDNTTNSTAKIPVISAKANTSAPAWTDGYMAPLSVNTSGSLRVTGSVLPLYGTNNQAITITLASLASAAARASTFIDNTSALYSDVLIFIILKTGASGTGTSGYVTIYGYGTADGGSNYPEGITGTDAGVTLTSIPNLPVLAQVATVANATTYKFGPFSFCKSYGLDLLPAQWGIVVSNQSGHALDTTSGNFSVFYQGVNRKIGL